MNRVQVSAAGDKRISGGDAVTTTRLHEEPRGRTGVGGLRQPDGSRAQCRAAGVTFERELIDELSAAQTGGV